MRPFANWPIKRHMAATQPLLSPRFGMGFYTCLGFSHEKDLAESMPGYFDKEDADLWSCVKIKIHRFLHFAHSGVWLNPHVVGQALNQYRFQEGVNQKIIEDIEKIFNKNINPKFVEHAYQSAEQETTVESLKNNLSFFFQFIKSPTTVGSLLPSSEKLANGIVYHIPDRHTEGPARHYIEVGPGSGAFTKELIKKLRTQDRLDLVEYDDKFVQILRKRFGHLKNIAIIQGDFTQFTSPHKYDYCVSGLPLAAFNQEAVEKIYRVFDTIIKDGGTLAYFEYIGLPHFKKRFLEFKKKIFKRKDKKNFDKVLELKERYYRKHNGTLDTIWLNITPARVCRLRLFKSSAE